MVTTDNGVGGFVFPAGTARWRGTRLEGKAVEQTMRVSGDVLAKIYVQGEYCPP